jgi:hypothetical protein
LGDKEGLEDLGDKGDKEDKSEGNSTESHFKSDSFLVGELNTSDLRAKKRR